MQCHPKVESAIAGQASRDFSWEAGKISFSHLVKSVYGKDVVVGVRSNSINTSKIMMNKTA
jgi:hypothetical protein